MNSNNETTPKTSRTKTRAALYLIINKVKINKVIDV